MSVTARTAELIYERLIYTMSTELLFDNDVSLPELLHILRKERVTGTLSLDLSQGGVNRIRFHAQERVVQK